MGAIFMAQLMNEGLYDLFGFGPLRPYKTHPFAAVLWGQDIHNQESAIQKGRRESFQRLCDLLDIYE